MQPFILPSEPPVTHCLGLPNGHLLLINNTADACTVALPPNPHPSPGSIRVPTQLEAAQPNALPCSAPMSDIAIADLQGLGQDQVGRQHTGLVHGAGAAQTHNLFKALLHRKGMSGPSCMHPCCRLTCTSQR